MTNNKPKIRIVSIDDWTAVYIDGKSVYQGHEISTHHLLFDVLPENGIRLDLDISWVEGGPEDEAEANECGNLPDEAGNLIDTDTT